MVGSYEREYNTRLVSDVKSNGGYICGHIGSEDAGPNLGFLLLVPVLNGSSNSFCCVGKRVVHTNFSITASEFLIFCFLYECQPIAVPTSPCLALIVLVMYFVVLRLFLKNRAGHWHSVLAVVIY